MTFNPRDTSATLTSRGTGKTAAVRSGVLTPHVGCRVRTPEQEGGAGTTAAVTPHFLATEDAIDTMRAGGSAIDAAISANAVLGVVLPTTCGLGGDLFALVNGPGFGVPMCMNASGRAGQNSTAEGLRKMGHTAVPLQGPDSITVPGAVDGWLALHKRFGELPLATVLGPAIDLAENGFPVSFELSRSLVRLHPLIKRQGSAAPLYPSGPPRQDSSLRRPRYGAVLRAIGEEGRSALYNGEVGEAIVEATDNRITLNDLATDQAEWVKAAGIDVFGITAWTVPPNSQGCLTLATLKIFEDLDVTRDPEDPAFHHALIEAYRSVAWERDKYISDPETAQDVSFLLDARRLGERAAKISMDRIVHWPSPADAPGGTAFLATSDSSGLSVSLIQSNFWGIGSGISAGDTGVFLHNRGAGFNLIPGHRNELRPGKRPLHTLSPTLWTDNGATALVLGTRGGHFQPQILAQVAVYLLHAGLPPDEAQCAPRWQIDQLDTADTPVLTLEAPLHSAHGNALERYGHLTECADTSTEGWGPVALIDMRSGVVAAADPRVSTATALVG